MTIIEVHTMEIIKSNLPKIANELKRIADSLEVKTCCICGKAFKGHGHNPNPVETEGVCCDECNIKVLEARFNQAKKENEK